MARRESERLYSERRGALVEEVRLNARESEIDLSERVLAVIGETPRERFVPRHAREDAYRNIALPIGLGQTLSQPTMVAWMTSLLDLHGGENALEIGTGSGYQAYILSWLLPHGHLTTIERHRLHARRASRRLQALGIENVEVVASDGSAGYLPNAPYSRILLTAGAPSVSDKLVVQLASDGRLVAPVGGRDIQDLMVIDKDKTGTLSCRSEGKCLFVPLIGSEGWESG
jgi:protein-L-isoaspartate(D-aspartate) O-methyltransferase